MAGFSVFDCRDDGCIAGATIFDHFSLQAQRKKWLTARATALFENFSESITVLHKANVLQLHPPFRTVETKNDGYSRRSFLNQELQMPQNTKDSNGGKDHPVKETSQGGGKSQDKGSADTKSGSPTGSHNKGEKKTTP